MVGDFVTWVAQSSGLAAWVQAFGAILSLIVAIRIARSAATATRTDAKAAALALTRQLYRLFSEIAEDCKTERDEEIRRKVHALESLNEIAKSLRIDSLPSEMSAAYIEIFTLSGEARAYALQSINIHNHGHMGAIYLRFAERSEALLAKLQ